MGKKIKFYYVYENGYSPDYISGINSSIAPNNDLELNFFLERNALPKSEVFDFNEDGELSGQPSEIVPEDHNSQINMVRHIKNGIILDLDGAKDLQDLLAQYIKMIESEKK